MGLLNCLLYDTGPSNHPSTMKAFIFLCLVAAAMAEADPQYFYGGAHSYSPYTAYSAGLHYNSPYVYSGVHSYSPYSGLYNHYGKREAEADPRYVYSGVGYPYTTGLAHYNNFAYSGLYNHYTTPYVHSYGKREAEAEAQPWGTYYGGYSGYTRPYAYGSYAGYGGYRRGYNGWY